VRAVRRNLIVAIVGGLTAAWLAFGQARPVPNSPKAQKSGTKKTVKKKKTTASAKTLPGKAAAPAGKASLAAKPSFRTAASRKTSVRKTARAPLPHGQQHPTQERYKQIEEALAARGYLHTAPDGRWGPDSVEALRNFQAEHQLSPTGRLDAQSLIQLGLGPSE
jgi:peptidoglycan hydrolase-like protein with peptidoglycan-binding domain